MNREIPWGRCEASEQNLVGAGAVPEGEARETEESCCWIGIGKKIASALSSLTLARVLRGVHTLWAHSLGRPGCLQRAQVMLLSMKAVSWVLLTAPTLVASALPPAKIISVGMPRML